MHIKKGEERVSHFGDTTFFRPLLLNDIKPRGCNWLAKLENEQACVHVQLLDLSSDQYLLLPESIKKKGTKVVTEAIPF